MWRSGWILVLCLSFTAVAVTGCAASHRRDGDAGGTGGAGMGGGGTSGMSGAGGSGGTGGAECVPGKPGDVVEKLDLLFVVDNTGTMREVQQLLRVQFPRLIRALTTGVRSDGTTFAAVRDLHLGVVSTDMGLPGVPARELLQCGDEQTRPFGDDGVLRNLPIPGSVNGLMCRPNYPTFLAFQFGSSDADEVAADFGCLTSLGTAGCGFEMPLEAALRALWPSDNLLPNGETGHFAPDDRLFTDGTMNGKGGPSGANSGFLRNDATQGTSLVAVVIVSDEEDCSSHNMAHLFPPNLLSAGDPLRDVGLNLRCFNESVRLGSEAARDDGAGNLYGTSRYAQALKALRPGNENLMVFAAIVGVPTPLVDANQTNLPDFSDPTERNAYYDFLLNHPTMVERPDPSNAGTSSANLVPSCVRPLVDPVTGQEVIDPVTGQVVPKQRAFPPRRIVKVAQEFGENATIQSICADDFTPAFDQIIDVIGRNMGQPLCP